MLKARIAENLHLVRESDSFLATQATYVSTVAILRADLDTASSRERSRRRRLADTEFGC